MYTEVKEILLRLMAIASTQVKSTVSGAVVLAFEVRTQMTTIVQATTYGIGNNHSHSPCSYCRTFMSISS